MLDDSLRENHILSWRNVNLEAKTLHLEHQLSKKLDVAVLECLS